MADKELQKAIDAIIEEEVNAKLDEIQDLIDSGDLDKELGIPEDEEA